MTIPGKARRVLRFGFLLLSTCLLLTQTAAADSSYKYSTDDVTFIKNSKQWFKPENSACSENTGEGGGGTSLGSMVWNSSAQPPYYLEELMVNILQDLAQATGVPQSDTVTQEHVVAMVAWAYAEGGNITNNDVFNPWNAGLIGHDDLLSGGANASGLESFKDFNSGVQGNTIGITQSNQNRIGKILADPSSTAEQVLHAVAYYDETPGDKAWAWGPNPNDPGAVLNFNHTQYIHSLLSNLQLTRSDYANRASVEIGFGQEDTNHVPASTLQFQGGTSHGGGNGETSDTGCTGTSGTSPDCGSVTGNARIICDAQRYDNTYYNEGYEQHIGAAAWHKDCPTISFDNTSCQEDCSGLVNLAVYDVFGVDLDQDTSSEASDTKDWQPIPLSEVQPGDIDQPYGENGGHVEIVDHVKGGTVYTFGAHEVYADRTQDVGPASYSTSQYPSQYFLRYIGPGSQYNGGGS